MPLEQRNDRSSFSAEAMASVPVTFFVPNAALVSQVPRRRRDYWEWINVMAGREERVRTRPVWLGPYNWTIQTWFYLREAGFECQLSATMPRNGVIVTHVDFLPIGLVPQETQYFVVVKPDRGLGSRVAQFVVVQNRYDPIRFGLRGAVVASEYVNYWPQPNLLPRSACRRSAFENVCYMGNRRNSIGPVGQLEWELGGLNLKWLMPAREVWHDYRAIDAIVAVRPKVAAMAPAHMRVECKPAAKLYNAWLAGVPAIVSPDVAYREIRKSSLDFIEARDIDDVVVALRRLKADPELRREMAENGFLRAAEFTGPQTVESWKRLLIERVIPDYEAWVSSRVRRRWFWIVRGALRRSVEE